MTGTQQPSPAELAGIPRVTWAEFLAGHFQWKRPVQGVAPDAEHVGLIGPNGSGKTTLARQILDGQRYVTVFGTKPVDASLDRFRRLRYVDEMGRPHRGYERIEKWPPHATYERVLLWPKVTKLRETNARLGSAFRAALEQIFEEGNQTVYFDELRYVCRDLHLTAELQILWLQGRSNGISVMGGTQRPAFVPVEIYDQSTHLFFWRDNDDANLKRIGGVGAINAKLIRETVAHLPRHDVLYINTRTGAMLVTRAER
jgi:hypothetical protein